MLSIKQRKIKKKYRHGLIACLIITLTLFSGLTPFLDDNLLGSGRNNDKLKGSWYNPDFPEYLYEDDVDQTLYNFSAKEECYIIADIKNTDFTSFNFNDTQYNVSYGLNILPVDFGDSFSSYNISISQDDVNNDVFNWITVEPLYIKNGNIDVNLTSTTDISFYAGGDISILMQLNFSYNWLYLEVDNVVINNIYNTTEYPEVDPVYLTAWKYEGTYLQFDLPMEPKQHWMKIKGNGSIEYKIIVNNDWDNDLISDVEEIQKKLFSSELDPVVPNVWGFFEMGAEKTFNDNYIDETGLFQFYIPGAYTRDKYLSINVLSGLISEIIVDEDDLTFKDVEISNDYFTKSISLPYGKMSYGFHFIQYKYHPDMITHITFCLDGREMLILDRHGLKDTDADGLKDYNELKNGLNPYNPDTDGDGLIDNLDISPLASITLDKNELHQFVIPHDSTKNTLIDLIIKIPEMDYSTKDKTRIWKEGYEYGGGLEVSIQPVLRMFGNSSITMSELTNTWDKNNKTYSLTGVFPTYGDGVPDSDNPNSEVKLIPGKISEETFEFSFNYPINNPAKSDSVIDMRFDIVWMVSSHYANYTEIIHYYDFEDDIILQALTSREVQNVSYIIASPDSMIENEILWNLVQNSELGSFSYFDVTNDVVGSGSIDYNELLEHLIDLRETNPISTDANGNITENEVLYVSMNYTNQDLLNKISLKDLPNPSFEVNHSGDYETLFSFYSISDLGQEDFNPFELGESVGDAKICHVKTWYNFSDSESTDYEERYSIIEFPVSMKRSTNYENSEMLEITSVFGPQIPINKLPYSINEVSHDKIELINQTFIEKDQTESGLPKLSFDYNIDAYKEIYDTREWDVEASKLIFNEYSESTALILNFVKTNFFEYCMKWEADQMQLIGTGLIDDWDYHGFMFGVHPEDHNGFNQRFNIAIDNLKDPNIPLIEKLEALDTIDDWLDTDGRIQYRVLRDQYYDAWQNSITEELYDGDPALKKLYTTFDDQIDNLDTERRIYKIVVNDAQNVLKREIKTIENTARNILEQKQIEQKIIEDCVRNIIRLRNEIRKAGFICIAGGVSTLAVSLLTMAMGIIEIKSVLRDFWNEKYSDDPLGFVVRCIKGVLNTGLGINLFIMSFYVCKESYNLLSYKILKGITVSKTILKIGKWATWLSIAVIVADFLVSFIDLINNNDLISIEFVWQILELYYKTITIGIAPILIGAVFGFGWGILVGAIASLFWFIYDWIVDMLNPDPIDQAYPEPSMEIIEGADETYFSFPEADVKRHGSLEVGDEVNFTMRIHNDGNVMSYLRANFSAGGSSFTDYQGKWENNNGYEPDPTISGGEYATLEFSRTLQSPKPNLVLNIGIDVDTEAGARIEIYEKIEEIIGNIPIMDTNIADFYDDTTAWDKPEDYESLMDEYKTLKETYQHKDTAETLSKLSNRVAYDFLEDDDESVPSGWYVQNLGTQNFTVILRPNQDNDTNWEWSTEPTHYEAIDEDILYPSTDDDGEYINTKNGILGDSLENECFGFTTHDNVDNINTATLYLYGYRSSPLLFDTYCEVFISFDGGTTWDTEGYQLDSNMSTSKAWHTITWTGVSESDHENILIRLKPYLLDVGETFYIHAMYLNITYGKLMAEDPLIVSDHLGHNKVVELDVIGMNGDCKLIKDFGALKNSGKIELWISKDNFTEILFDDFFGVNDFGDVVEDDAQTVIREKAIELNTWNHFKIDYDSDSFDLYFNGIKIGDDISHSKSNFSEFVLYAKCEYDSSDEDEYTIGHVYVDAVDFSWSNGYYDGRSFAWDYSLDEIQEYGWEYGNLSIFRNIDTDLLENIVEMDTTTDKAEFDFYLDLEGTHNPYVNYTFDIPDGFTITPTEITEVLLDANIEFEIEADDPYQYAGIYYFEINITFADNDTLIYSELVPFRIPVDDDFTITQTGIIFDETDFNGNYTATYDWLLDTAETTPDDWTIVDSPTPLILDELDGHEMVVKIEDDCFVDIDYTGVHFDTDSQSSYPEGFCWDGTHFWVADTIDDEVYQYTSDGVYTGIHFDIYIDGYVDLHGITWDGTYFWIVAYDDNIIFQCTSTGVVTDKYFIENEDGIPTGMVWDGTYFWVLGAYTDEVYQYTYDGVYTGIHFDVGSVSSAPEDIVWDGTFFWIVDALDNEVYQYTYDGVYTGIHFDVGSETYAPKGITWDGTFFSVISSTTTGEVFQYKPSSKIYNNFDVQTSGTVELWVRKSSVAVGDGGHYSSEIPISLSLTGSSGTISFSIDDNNNGKIKYLDGLNWNYICDDFDYEDDIWYHIEITFNCDLDKYVFSIDGQGEHIELLTDITSFTQFNVQTNDINKNGTIYLDTVGYSWKSDYIIGDNLYKTHISTEEYESSTQLKKGDIIFIEYKTNTYAEVIMDFLNNDVIQGTYTMIPRGNLYSGIQYQQIIIDDDFSFDEIEFSSYEYNYLEVNHISIIDATATISQEFNPIDFTNEGNVPKFVTLDFSGIMDTIENSTEYDTGWVEAQTLETVDRDGKRTWLNPSNAKLEDGSNAISDVFKSTYSDWLRLTNFYNGGTGYDIPIGAEITGIEVKIKRKGELADYISDSSLRLRKTSGQVGDDKASATKYTTTLTWAIYGSSLDNWNTGLTSSDLNSADFGIDLSSVNGYNKVRMAYVDAAFIKIHYKTYGDDIEEPYESKIVTILPNEFKELNLDLNLPIESISNLLYREITYTESGTNNIYNIYVDNLEFDGIYIISPQNMIHNILGHNGYYPATYSFENDGVGSNPNGWNISEPGSTSIEIVKNIELHKSIVKISDNDVEASALLESEFDNQESGTIEFWLLTTDKSKNFNMAGTYIDGWKFVVSIDNGYITYYDTSSHNILAIDDNTWYHIRIDFECDTGGYQGLEADEFNIYIDGIKYGEYDFYSDSNSLNGMWIMTESPHTGYDNYIDAVGYSWDSDYDVGNNRYEGILLDIIPEETLVSSKYSLDGNVNVTFSESVIIPVPEIGGKHTIQVFGENAEEDEFESIVKNFTVQYPIEISTISNGTTYYDTNNKIFVNVSFMGCEDFEYSLDGRPRKTLNITTNLIEHIPYGSHNIIVYGDDIYGDEYSSGLIEFYIALDRQSALQPEGFTFTYGELLEPYGDLQFIDDDYSRIRYDIDDDENPNEFIDSIDYNIGSSGSGTLENTQTDDSDYKRIEDGLNGAFNQISIVFNINPDYAGRNFYFSYHSYTDVFTGGALKINGEKYGSNANTHDFDNVIFENVNSITYNTFGVYDGHYLKVYYFKLVECPCGILDLTVDLQVDDEDIHEVEFLQYSHKTNVSAIVNLDIWDWNTEQWDEIESVDNYETFDDHRIILGNRSDYLNLNDNSVKIRFQSIDINIDIQLEIDSLKLLYSTNVIPLNLYETPIQPDDFTITKGTFDTYGDLGDIDDNDSIISSVGGIGHYPATYSFENDDDNTDPEGWTVFETGGTLNVISELDGHSKIVDFHKTSAGSGLYVRIEQEMSQNDGTIEFWWRVTEYRRTHFTLYDDTPVKVVAFSLYDGTNGNRLRYYDNGWINSFQYSLNTWYRFVVGFDCDSDTWSLSVYDKNGAEEHNGADYSTYNNVDNINEIEFSSGTFVSGWHQYVDAIGYSWDPNYDIGDNIEDGSGYYPATYSFTDETIGTSGDNIDFVDSNTFPTCEIEGLLDGHDKILELGTTGGVWYKTENVFTDQISGTIEFWVRVSQVTYYTARLIVRDDATNPIQIRFHEDGNIGCHDGSWNTLTAYTINTWYHIRVDFECGAGEYMDLGADTYKVYINSAEYGPYDLAVSVDTVNTFYFDTGSASANVRYLDAVGYSWDPDYDIGDNKINNVLILDFQVDIQVDDEYCYFPNSISYSYKTDISQIIDFDIWNWDIESWYKIESVDNHETFDYDVFWLEYGSSYVNSENGIRIRFQAFNCENDFQIEIDQLRLDYYNIG